MPNVIPVVNRVRLPLRSEARYEEFRKVATQIIDPEPDAQSSWLRPQSVVFTLLAEHVLGRDVAVFSGSFIEVLGRLGMGEHATRSTLARMTERGLLERRRFGRKTFFALTPRCAAILQDGRRRIWETGVANTSKSDLWTLLAFSLPESWQRKRYDLRSRLSWAGFGSLQKGVWLAPSEVDVGPIIDELELTDQVRVFHIRPAPPTNPGAVIRSTFDLEALAQRYRAFSRTWQSLGARDVPDALVFTLRLSTQWLRIIRDDPRVPIHLLPPNWPAIHAQELFRTLHGAHRDAARALANELFETIE